MVKNTFGGSSHKKFARSSMAPSANKAFLRTVKEEGELYAYVNKMFGNGMCNVVDMDGREYLCIIRGKFRGKNKKNNKLEIGTWVLVGLRGWESSRPDEKLTCDLLEIYTKDEIDRLKSTVRGNWKTTCDEIGGGVGGSEADSAMEDGVVFSTNEDAFDYDEMMRSGAAESSKKISLAVSTSAKNDWLCDDGEEEDEEAVATATESEAEEKETASEDIESSGLFSTNARSKKEKNGNGHKGRHVTRRIEEYIDFDSI
jgi:initiation factor 1A